MYTFDKQAAQSADRHGITESGVYYGFILSNKFGKTANGAEYVEFTLSTDEGDTVRFITIYTSKINGEKAFGYGHIQSLMGLIGLTDLQPAETEEGQCFPILNNKKIAFALQKEWYYNKLGDKKYKLNLLHFFDHETSKTFAEKLANKDAKVFQSAIKDKVPDGASVEAQSAAVHAAHSAVPF